MTQASHKLNRFCFICGLLLVSATSVAAQAAMQQGDAQRSRVFATRSVNAPPRYVLWKVEKLFRLNTALEVITHGPIVIMGIGDFTVPIVSDGTLFFVVNIGHAYFYAFDAATGKQIMVQKFDNNSLSWPAAIGRTAFFGTHTNVYAYNGATGTRAWTFEQKGAAFSGAAPVIVDEVIYLCSDESGVFALASDTGALNWTFKFNESLHGPAVQGEHVVVLSKNALIALDRKTGSKTWETDIGREFFGPTILDDQVFVEHLEGEVRAYALQDGALKWKSKKEGGALTALALFNGSVIYGEKSGNVVALDARTGLVKWRFKTSKPCNSPFVAGTTLYTRCRDRYLYALDPNTGELKWSLDTGGTGLTPVIANGVMFSINPEGALQAARP